ncbi:MAG: hypothetical protein DWQ06_12190 [Calditrichaeota bacterium]|nr:MAG: hypothetical protein DWQ06_12190 [Calditrichota bacterium]
MIGFGLTLSTFGASSNFPSVLLRVGFKVGFEVLGSSFLCSWVSKVTVFFSCFCFIKTGFGFSTILGSVSSFLSKESGF